MSDATPVIGATYTVKKGDTITEIAFLAYGDARRYLELAMHNQTVPGFNPARLRAGMEIEIPEPDYLPMPSGVGGMRGGVGKSFSVTSNRRIPLPVVSITGQEEDKDNT